MFWFVYFSKFYDGLIPEVWMNSSDMMSSKQKCPRKDSKPITNEIIRRPRWPHKKTKNKSNKNKKLVLGIFASADYHIQ